MYRHAHAFGLFAKRQRNIRAALERIIEHAGEVEVTSSRVVAAVQAYSKINAAGQWIDRSESVSLYWLAFGADEHSGAGSLRADGRITGLVPLNGRGNSGQQ